MEWQRVRFNFSQTFAQILQHIQIRWLNLVPSVMGNVLDEYIHLISG